MKFIFYLRLFYFCFLRFPNVALQREYLQIAMDSNLRDIGIAQKELDYYDELGEVGRSSEDDG